MRLKAIWWGKTLFASASPDGVGAHLRLQLRQGRPRPRRKPPDRWTRQWSGWARAPPKPIERHHGDDGGAVGVGNNTVVRPSRRPRLISGTTSGTSASMRKALELSTKSAPARADGRREALRQSVARRAQNHVRAGEGVLRRLGDGEAMARAFQNRARAARAGQSADARGLHPALQKNLQHFPAHCAGCAQNGDVHVVVHAFTSNLTKLL